MKIELQKVYKPHAVLPFLFTTHAIRFSKIVAIDMDVAAFGCPGSLVCDKSSTNSVEYIDVLNLVFTSILVTSIALPLH
jgi:hypothetical protein